MTVDIYLKEKSGSREIRIPWLPEEIECSNGSAIFATYDILNTGEVAIPTGTELSEYAWSSEFPGKTRNDKTMQRGAWKEPKNYDNILKDWLAKGTPLRLMVTGYPINVDVVISEYQSRPAGGFGDLPYEIRLIQKRSITITSTKVKTPAKRATSTSSSTAKYTSYTIKSGDTLWGIAQKKLGSGAKWKTIYNANKDIIEKTAKKYGKSSSSNGHWIYPGVTIKIPK